MTISTSANPHTFGWVKGELVLKAPQQLIIKANPHSPMVIKAVIPHHIVMAIVEKRLDLDRLWKVVPQTYPGNGVISKVWIHELPQHKRKTPQPNTFIIAGTLTAANVNKFKIVPPHCQNGITINGILSERYKIGDILYAKATLRDRALHLEQCCSDLEYAIGKQESRPLKFTLSEYPHFLPFSPQKGKCQFWVRHGSEQVAVLVSSEQIQDLEILRCGYYKATITGTVERISGLATILDPCIQTSINEQRPSSPKNDSPRARLLGESLA